MSSSAITGASLGLQAFGQARQSEANERAGREQRRFLGREAGRRRDSGLGRQIFGLLGLGGGSIQSPEELAAGITGIRRQGAAAGNQATQQAVMNRLGRSGVSGGQRAGIEGQLAGQSIQNIANVDAGEAQLQDQIRRQRLADALNANQILNPVAGAAVGQLGQSIGQPNMSGQAISDFGQTMQLAAFLGNNQDQPQAITNNQIYGPPAPQPQQFDVPPLLAR